MCANVAIDFIRQMNSSQAPETRKINSLTIGGLYTVKEMKRVQTIFGDKIIAIIADDPDDRFQIFLPKRYSRSISDECIKHFNEKKGLELKYNGGIYNEVIFTRKN